MNNRRGLSLTLSSFTNIMALMLRKYSVFISLLVMASIIACLTFSTEERNRVYETPVTLWADAASKSINKRRTHENYGQALSTAGKYPEALREFNTVLALRDDGSVPLRDLYREIGVVDFRVGRIDDAIVSWQTGLRYAPGDPGLLNNLSVAFAREQRYDEAEAAARQALTVDPDQPYPLNTLGEILMAKGNYEEALKCFLVAIEREPDNPARYWNAAVAFEKTGQYDRAYTYASRFAAMEMSSETRQRALAYVNRLQSLYLSKRKP
jgi:tetratricopeptide (TPR) repeat protein